MQAMQAKMRRFTGAAGKIAMLMLAIALFIAFIGASSAEPSGPTITFMNNETKATSGAATINTSGGSITTVILNTTTQNLRWKAYVGNVTGTLTLDDASDNTIFDWTGINCSNSTHITNENKAINHTNRDDNITATFSQQLHSGFYVGTRQILANTCKSLHTYVNSTSQNSRFEEVAMYDGAKSTGGHVVYAAPLEQDQYGFDNSTYDFQMIVPENGLPGFQSSTAYYFYVE